MRDKTHTNALKSPLLNSAFIGYVIALLVLIVWVENIQNQNLFWGPLHDSAHAFAFFLLVRALCVLRIKFSEKGAPKSALVSGSDLAKIGFSCFTLGIIIELVQPLLQRSASFHDISYNFFGITSELTYQISKHKQTTLNISLKVSSAALLSIALIIPLVGAYTLQQRDKILPTLLDFEDDWQHRLYRKGGSANLSLSSHVKAWDNPGTSLKVDFLKTDYPGFSVPHISGNWTGYKVLTFDVFSKSEHAQLLTVRVHDDTHTHAYNDRFNRTLSIEPGLNKVEISIVEIKNAPTSRTLDMTRIASIAMFSSSPKKVFSLYFDNIQLTNDSSIRTSQ